MIVGGAYSLGAMGRILHDWAREELMLPAYCAEGPCYSKLIPYDGG